MLARAVLVLCLLVAGLPACVRIPPSVTAAFAPAAPGEPSHFRPGSPNDPAGAGAPKGPTRNGSPSS